MRKLTMEIEPFDGTKEFFGSTFDNIHSYEILETLKIDYEGGICVDLIEFTVREGISIKDIGSVGKMEIMSILRSEGSQQTCLVKYSEEEGSLDMYKDFDMDLIPTTPTIISKEKLTVSYIGDNQNLRRLIELARSKVGNVEKMSFQNAKYQKQDILSVLTDKQRDILLAAHRYGYYDYPKKINSKRLSERVQVSTATLVEHLRKAEGRLLKEILAGYT